MPTPEEILAETIHVDANAPMRENLENLAHVAKVKARLEKKYVTINHHVDAAGTESILFKSHDPEFFEKGLIQCPREADATYEAQNGGAPRPLPSILATPDDRVVASKPSLCDGCIHRLHRAAKGSCEGLQFKPIGEGFDGLVGQKLPSLHDLKKP